MGEHLLASILAGKPLGILAAVGLAVGAGLELPQRFGWNDLIVVGCAAGIGFTVALLFADGGVRRGPAAGSGEAGLAVERERRRGDGRRGGVVESRAAQLIPTS